MPFRLTYLTAAFWICACIMTAFKACGQDDWLAAPLILCVAAAAALTVCSFICWQARENRRCFWLSRRAEEEQIRERERSAPSPGKVAYLPQQRR